MDILAQPITCCHFFQVSEIHPNNFAHGQKFPFLSCFMEKEKCVNLKKYD